MPEAKREYWRWKEESWADPKQRWKDAQVITLGIDVGSIDLVCQIQSAKSVRDATYGLWAGGAVTLIRNGFWAAGILAFFAFQTLPINTVGILLILLAIGIREAFSRFGGEIPATAPQVQLRTVLIAVASGVLVTLVSALVPAYRASAVPPIAALRQVVARPSSRLFRIVTIVGSVVSVTGSAIIAA